MIRSEYPCGIGEMTRLRGIMIMRAKIGLFCIVLLACISGAQGKVEKSIPDIIFDEQAQKWGYVDRTGKMVIEPRFDDVGKFSEGLAPFSVGLFDKAKWGFIDKTGSVVIEPQFGEALGFEDGLSAVRVGDRITNKWVMIDKTGKVVLEPGEGAVRNLHDGLALVNVVPAYGGIRELYGECGYIDRSGKTVIKRQYERAWDFSEGLAPVFIGTIQGKWGYIDTKGEIAIDPQFLVASPFSEGLAFVVIRDGADHDGYIDKTGKLIISLPHSNTASDENVDFHEGLAVIPSSNWSTGWPLAGYIDKTGKTVIKAGFEKAGCFSDGLAPASKEYEWGFIDKLGEFVVRFPFGCAQVRELSEGLAAIQMPVSAPAGTALIEKVEGIATPPRASHVTPISEAMAPFRAGGTGTGKWGYTDESGTVIIKPEFDRAWPFHDGLALVRLRGKPGYINGTGKLVIQPKVDEAQSFSEGMAAVRIGKKWGFINKQGKVAIRPQFDHAGCFTKGRAPVTIGARSGYIDKTGKLAANP